MASSCIPDILASIPAPPSPSLVRRLKYTESMTSKSDFEASKAELEFLLTQPTITPSAKIYLLFLHSYFESRLLWWDNNKRYPWPAWSEKKKKDVTKTEGALAMQLKQDHQHQVLKVAFQELTLNNIRLRYRKHHHQGLVQTSGDSNNHSAQNLSDNTQPPHKVGWDAVWEKIKADVQELEKWETDWWWRLFHDEPRTPWLEYWRDFARSIWFCLEDVISQIKYKENETSEISNLESLRRDGNMTAVAQILAQDRKALRKRVVDIDLEQTRDEMLDALEEYKKRYFVYIGIEEGQGRYSGMVEYELTPEERQRVDKIHSIREEAFGIPEPLPLAQLGSLMVDETPIFEDGGRHSQSQIASYEKGPRMRALGLF